MKINIESARKNDEEVMKVWHNKINERRLEEFNCGCDIQVFDDYSNINKLYSLADTKSMYLNGNVK
jgi:hypothetical protein